MNPGHIQTYVEELRAFSATHRIPTGHPHDLLTLPSTLSSNERFRAEFGSMVRSFRYREHDGISFNELIPLVTAAWGGSDTPVLNGPPPPWLAELSLVLRDILSRSPGEPPPILIEEKPKPQEAQPSAHPPQPQPIPAFPADANPAFAGTERAVSEEFERPRDPTPGNDYAQVLSQRVKRNSGSHPTAEVKLPTADPWAEDSWLHRQLQAFQSTHPRRLFRVQPVR